MIEDGVSGYLVESGDYNMLAEKIEELCKDDGKREEMGQKFYERALNNFSVEAMASTHIKIYDRIIKECK